MRKYAIYITGTDGSAASGGTFTSESNGVNNPGALDVEFDIYQQNYAVPMGNSYVKIWGVPLQTISQASDFNNKLVTIYAGMGKGLPLATAVAPYYGLIARGVIQQAFGNWINTEQSLDLIIVPGAGSSSVAVSNLSANMKKGSNLSDGIKTTLQNAYPGATVSVNISNDLVLTNDLAGFYGTLAEFAYLMNDTSKAIIRDSGYNGVSMTQKDNQILVSDGKGSTAPTVKNIAFQDLIGQPTWIGLNQVQFKTVIRSDFNVQDRIKFPPGLQVTTTAASQSQARDKSAFQGTFDIQLVRHNGHSRQPGADSWITTVNAVTTA